MHLIQMLYHNFKPLQLVVVDRLDGLETSGHQAKLREINLQLATTLCQCEMSNCQMIRLPSTTLVGSLLIRVLSCFFSVADRLGQLNTKPRSRWPAWTRPWLAAGSYYKQHSRPPCVTAGRTPWYPPWAACHRTPVSIICGTFFCKCGKLMHSRYNDLKHSSTALQTIQESMFK